MKISVKKIRTNSKVVVWVQAAVLAMGFWGFIHFFIAIGQSIHQQNLSLINALRLTRLNIFINSFVDNPVIFVGGWLVFGLTIYCFWRALMRKDDAN